jgi:hypothetical protein
VAIGLGADRADLSAWRVYAALRKATCDINLVSCRLNSHAVIIAARKERVIIVYFDAEFLKQSA